MRITACTNLCNDSGRIEQFAAMVRKWGQLHYSVWTDNGCRIAFTFNCTTLLEVFEHRIPRHEYPDVIITEFPFVLSFGHGNHLNVDGNVRNSDAHEYVSREESAEKMARR